MWPTMMVSNAAIDAELRRGHEQGQAGDDRRQEERQIDDELDERGGRSRLPIPYKAPSTTARTEAISHRGQGDDRGIGERGENAVVRPQGHIGADAEGLPEDLALPDLRPAENSTPMIKRRIENGEYDGGQCPGGKFGECVRRCCAWSDLLPAHGDSRPERCRQGR